MATPPAAVAATAIAAVALLLVLLGSATVLMISSSSEVAAGEDEVFSAESAAVRRGRQVVVVPAMYVFGDSLMDAGNNNLFPPPAPKSVPPYGIDLPLSVSPRTGRFTNGYNLADIIAQYLGFKMSPPAYLSGNGTIPLRAQVQLFAETKATIIQSGLVSHKRLEDLLSQSLFLISSGGNDLAPFDIAGVPMSQAPEFITGIVADYVKYISELYRLGARRLAVFDLLPAGCLPSQRAAMADGECHADGNSLSAMFNAVLRTEIAKAVVASMPCLKYSINSLYNAYSDMIANPALAGM
nr:unnamed protein product [Digitaria exilis]